MPTTRQRRSRRASKLTGAELKWLTGDAQGQHVNKFELLRLEHPSRPDDFDRIAALLAQAAGVVPPQRIAELRAELRAERERQEYRRTPEGYSAWLKEMGVT